MTHVTCINKGNAHHLTTDKVYQVDLKGIAKSGYIRVFNDRGDSVNYDQELFVAIGHVLPARNKQTSELPGNFLDSVDAVLKASPTAKKFLQPGVVEAIEARRVSTLNELGPIPDGPVTAAIKAAGWPRDIPQTYGLGQADPTGKSQHSSGAKLDAGKPRVGLVLGGFARALLKVAEVGTMGAKKYTADGWVSVPDGEARYTDAGLRHFLYNAIGEELDPESGIEHLAHEAWNALARLDLALRRKEKTE